MFRAPQGGLGSRRSPNHRLWNSPDMVSARLTRQSAEAILTALFADQKALAALIRVEIGVLMDRALARTPGFGPLQALALISPLVALGASAPVHYPAIADMLDIAKLRAGPCRRRQRGGRGCRPGPRDRPLPSSPSLTRAALPSTGAGAPVALSGNLDEAFALARELARRRGVRGRHPQRRRPSSGRRRRAYRHAGNRRVSKSLSKPVHVATASGRPRIAENANGK
jgi:hypothetical protein